MEPIVFVTVEIFGGIVDFVNVYRNRAEAEQRESEWLKRNAITNEDEREAYSQNKAAEFLIHETTLH